MNVLQKKIEEWLSRPAPERAINQCLGLSTVLATDIGLERTENQDRVAALKIGTGPNGRPLIAVVVVDGMGGMREGGKCAILALSSFFYALISNRGAEAEKRAEAAIAYANQNVFGLAKGKGGATLSAILVDHELRPIIVHVGDSRIYSFGSRTAVKRLTTDDSLAEKVGGYGRELLQFIGMGEGMQPHIMPILDHSRQVAITTDGIHFTESATLESVLRHSSALKVASERLSALARWCGGPDNASSAIFDLPSIMQEVFKSEDTGIEFWDPFGSMTAIWIQPSDLTNVGMEAGQLSNAAHLNAPPKVNSDSSTPKRKAVKKTQSKVKDRRPNKDIQFEIKIEQPPALEADNDSK